MAKKSPSRESSAPVPQSAQQNNIAEDEVDPSLFPSTDDAQEAEDIWGAGQERSANANPVGTFQGEITDAVLERSSGGRLQVHYSLKILVGPKAETEIPKYDGLGSEKQAAVTQGQLRRLGIKTEGLSLKKLPAVLLTLRGVKIQFTTKQNGEFYNVSFNKVLTGDIVAQAAAGKAPVAPGARRF